MNLPSHRFARLIMVLAYVLGASGCKDSNNLSGPRPTPTPTPVPIAGAWVGDWDSNLIVLCDQQEPGTSTAALTETGSAVTGTIRATGGCGFSGSIQGVRIGNQLTGSASEGAATGTFTGELVGAELHLSISNLTTSQGTSIGGSATLHRP